MDQEPGCGIFRRSAHTVPDSLASTPGAPCVFNAPKAVVLAGVDLGHVGWGYELPNGTWEFGAKTVPRRAPD